MLATKASCCLRLFLLLLYFVLVAEDLIFGRNFALTICEIYLTYNAHTHTSSNTVLVATEGYWTNCTTKSEELQRVELF